jgi:quercetin dioxygenase-like cupin family protein
MNSKYGFMPIVPPYSPDALRLDILRPHGFVDRITTRTAMDIQRSGSQPSKNGPQEYFTGTVRLDAPFHGSGHLSGAAVTFEPGARTAWHTHPMGQTLLVTAGLGRIQRQGGPIEEIRPGDIVWFEPGEKHWHGASPDCAMTHIAIAEMKDGKAVDWMEKVSDEQYLGKARQ